MRLKLIALVAVAAGLAACAPRQTDTVSDTVVVTDQGTPIYAKDGVTIVGYANDPMM